MKREIRFSLKGKGFGLWARQLENLFIADGYLPEADIEEELDMTYIPDKYWEPEDDRTEAELIAICEEDGYNYEGLELPFE